jgi:hypothetical protein
MDDESDEKYDNSQRQFTRAMAKGKPDLLWGYMSGTVCE